MTTVPAPIVQIRKELCGDQCKADPHNPCVGCENGHWGPYVFCREEDKSTLGDKIASVATPIAKLVGAPCVDKKTGELKPESGCAKMKARLNAGMSFSDAIKLRLKGE